MNAFLTRISTDAFEELQLDAGTILLEDGFDPNNPYAIPSNEQIFATTTGNITPSLVPRTSDFFADVNGAQDNTLEGLHIDGWDGSLGFSSIKFNPAGVQRAVGFADVTELESGVHLIKPRRTPKRGDFQKLWFVAPKADGGGVAILLKNSVSTGGFGMTTTKNGKGTLSMTLTCFTSIYDDPEDVPMEIYIIPPEGGANTLVVLQRLSHVTSSYSDEAVDSGDDLTVTLTAASGYTLTGGEVSVKMGGVDITALVYSSGTITIPAVTSGVVIDASAVPT